MTINIDGDVIVYMQTNNKNNPNTAMHLDRDIFNILYDIMYNNRKLDIKNKSFFNIYYEIRKL